LGWLALATVISLAATFVNPYRWDIWLEPYRTLTDKALHDNIVEWFAAGPYSTTGTILFGVLVLLVFTFVVRKGRTDLTEASLVLAFFVSALLAVRNVPLFLLMAVPLGLEGLRTLKPNWAGLAIRLWPTLLALAFFIVAGVSKFPLDSFAKLDRDTEIFKQGDYPVEAATFLAEHTEYADSHPYNEYGWGGYLLYQVPWFKTFIDGRMPSWQQGELKIIDRYFEIDRRENWQATADEFRVDLFILKSSHGLVGELSKDKDFTEVFRDDNSVIFVKQK
ncbi:MAG: hypothetical protein V1895_03310, partial [Parcubacteria group bacterium]